MAYTPRSCPRILNVETQKAVALEKVHPSVVHYALDSTAQVASKPRCSAVPNRKTSLHYNYTSYNYAKDTTKPTDL